MTNSQYTISRNDCEEALAGLSELKTHVKAWLSFVLSAVKFDDHMRAVDAEKYTLVYHRVSLVVRNPGLRVGPSMSEIGELALEQFQGYKAIVQEDTSRKMAMERVKPLLACIEMLDVASEMPHIQIKCGGLSALKYSVNTNHHVVVWLEEDQLVFDHVRFDTYVALEPTELCGQKVVLSSKVKRYDFKITD